MYIYFIMIFTKHKLKQLFELCLYYEFYNLFMQLSEILYYKHLFLLGYILFI